MPFFYLVRFRYSRIIIYLIDTEMEGGLSEDKSTDSLWLIERKRDSRARFLLVLSLKSTVLVFYFLVGDTYSTVLNFDQLFDDLFLLEVVR